MKELKDLGLVPVEKSIGLCQWRWNIGWTPP